MKVYAIVHADAMKDVDDNAEIAGERITQTRQSGYPLFEIPWVPEDYDDLNRGARKMSAIYPPDTKVILLGGFGHICVPIFKGQLKLNVFTNVTIDEDGCFY
ncbi:hypothetical protein ACFLQN_03940 [Candidatus Aenigmatarchaeota archaeon]